VNLGSYCPMQLWPPQTLGALGPASISQNTETSQIFHNLENSHPLVAKTLRPAVQAIVRAMYKSLCTNLSQHRVQPSIQLPLSKRSVHAIHHWIIGSL
jgi:hypothetical protein